MCFELKLNLKLIKLINIYDGYRHVNNNCCNEVISSSYKFYCTVKGKSQGDFSLD